MTTTSSPEPEPWESPYTNVTYTNLGPAGEVTWTSLGTPVISTGSSTWNINLEKKPDFNPNRTIKLEPTKKDEPPLPHPRRYLDGEKTRCPDCGAVTRDPSVLLTIPCKVPPHED